MTPSGSQSVNQPKYSQHSTYGYDTPYQTVYKYDSKYGIPVIGKQIVFNSLCQTYNSLVCSSRVSTVVPLLHWICRQGDGMHIEMWRLIAEWLCSWHSSIYILLYTIMWLRLCSHWSVIIKAFIFNLAVARGASQISKLFVQGIPNLIYPHALEVTQIEKILGSQTQSTYMLRVPLENVSELEPLILVQSVDSMGSTSGCWLKLRNFRFWACILSFLEKWHSIWNPLNFFRAWGQWCHIQEITQI